MLRSLLEHSSLMTAYFNQGHDFLMTSLLKIAPDGNTVVIDVSSNSEMNKRALTSDRLICVANLDKVTKSNGRVMLTGEPGSGKEMAARFIHANSNRAAGAIVPVLLPTEQVTYVGFHRQAGETPLRTPGRTTVRVRLAGVGHFTVEVDPEALNHPPWRAS